MTAPLYKRQNPPPLITGFMQTIQNNVDLDARFLKGVDIDQKDCYGFTAMHWAVYHDNLRNIKILLRHGSRLETSKGMNALFCAVLYDRMDVLRYFIEKGLEPAMEYKGYTLLSYARKLKRSKIFVYLNTVQTEFAETKNRVDCEAR